MVGFFPTPYPDECFYSILCRYSARSGIIWYESNVRELFGKIQNLTPSIYMPIRLECLDNWANSSSGITRNSMVMNHTLASYWAMTYPPSLRDEIDKVMKGNAVTATISKSKAYKRSQAKYLRYCPLCAAEDIEKYGETYWRRQHQLAEMFYCSKHKVRLVDSSILIKDTSTRFCPASNEVTTDLVINNSDALLPYKDKLLKIGAECEWLIANGLNIDWNINGYDKYWRLLRDKGLASIKGYCNDHNALNKSFFDYWGKDFLDTLFDAVGQPRFESWYHKFGKVNVSYFTSLFHILVMYWLSGSIKDFTLSDPAETPFGHPPFVCENPICSHYHMDGAEIVDMSDYGSGIAAYFKCNYCGLIYKYTKSTQSKEQRVIIDYGHLWDSELRRCCQDPKITIEQSLKIMKCSLAVLQLQKKKRGILINTTLFDKKMGAEAYYKAKVTEVCNEYDEVTIALLDEKVPGAYVYLQKRHNEWIRKRIVFDNERQFRLERESFLLTRLQDIISEFDAEGYPDEQLSYGFIASLIGSTRDELRYSMSPNSELRAFLDEIIEHRKTWRQERAERIIERKSKRGSLLLRKLRALIADFEENGYPDKQLSQEYVASLIDSTRNELRSRLVQNEELQAMLNEVIEHRGVWRKERKSRLNGSNKKRENKLRESIEQIIINPPEQQISYNYIAKIAGLTNDVMKDSPNLRELVSGIVETKEGWIKRRFTAAYKDKPIRHKPYTAKEICRMASIDWNTFNKRRELFENMLKNLNSEEP